MTGAAIAALCAAGVTPQDPDLAARLALLHRLQDPATGGFVAPPRSSSGWLNTDTTGWVTSGLIRCGIDPQGPEWTTDQGKTPFDSSSPYSVPMAILTGPTNTPPSAAFETFNSVRPLAGVPASRPQRRRGSTASAPGRAAGTRGRRGHDRAGDAGDRPRAGRRRRADVPGRRRVGIEPGARSSTDAEAGATPAGCVDRIRARRRGPRLLNGVAETPEYGWSTRVDGAPSGGPIGFGDLVFAKFAATVADPGPAPAVEVPALKPGPEPQAAGTARGRPRQGAGAAATAISVVLRCPRGNGEAGCRGTLAVQFRKRRGGPLLDGGSALFEVGSGERRRSPGPDHGGAARGARLEAAGEAADHRGDPRRGRWASRLTHARRLVSG